MFQGLSTATAGIEMQKISEKEVHRLITKINRLLSNNLVEKLTHDLMFQGSGAATTGADRQKMVGKVVKILMFYQHNDMVELAEILCWL
jgi:hypothetical protein